MRLVVIKPYVILLIPDGQFILLRQMSKGHYTCLIVDNLFLHKLLKILVIQLPDTEEAVIGAHYYFVFEYVDDVNLVLMRLKHMNFD